MEVVDIARSPDDVVFRAKVRQLLDGARERVGIIAGEFGAYRYADLREGVQQAIHRGVEVEGYGNQPSSDVIDKMTSDGVRLTIGGLRSLHHYFVADNLSSIASYKAPDAGPTTPGTRWGKMYLGDPEMGGAISSYQRFLQASAKGTPPMQLLNELTTEIGIHPLLARRIRIADNVLSLAGVESPPPSGLVEAMLATFNPPVSDRLGTNQGSETELALVNQIALITASMALAQFTFSWDAPVISQIEANRESVAEANRAMRFIPKQSSPRHSIWEDPS
jgi:hypothetical protein